MISHITYQMKYKYFSLLFNQKRAKFEFAKIKRFINLFFCLTISTIAPNSNVDDVIIGYRYLLIDLMTNIRIAVNLKYDFPYHISKYQITFCWMANHVYTSQVTFETKKSRLDNEITFQLKYKYFFIVV